MFGDLYFEYLILLLYMMFYFYGVDNKQKVKIFIIFKTLANFGASKFQHYLEVFPFCSTYLVHDKKYHSLINLFNGERKKNLEIVK